MRLSLKPEPSAKAEAIVNSINNSMEIEKKTKSLTVDENRIRKFIIEAFPRFGRAPKIQEVNEAFREVGAGSMDNMFKKLDQLDMIYLKDDEILGAYPFSAKPTPHRVAVQDKESVYAMCAIDALGVAFMMNRDVQIESFCSDCGQDIRIEVCDGSIASHTPEEILVFVGLKCSERAATSLCTTLLFFDAEQHLQNWKVGHPDELGESLSLPEALYVGKEFFKDFLS